MWMYVCVQRVCGTVVYVRIPYSGKFSRMVDFYYFAGLDFTDASTHTHYVLYNQAFFTGLIFVIRRWSVKTTKIGPLKNFLLYSSTCLESNVYTLCICTWMYQHGDMHIFACMWMSIICRLCSVGRAAIFSSTTAASLRTDRESPSISDGFSSETAIGTALRTR